jgi:tRNA-(ms[2]io[6]A)-hydroxylase
MRRRPNGYTRALHRRIAKEAEPRRKIDRLIVGALIEARSCERFTRLLEVLPAGEAEVASLLAEVGPAERRHWRMFYELAAREADPGWFGTHWQGWLATEREIVGGRGTSPAVHG